jgi:hypothetical protein
VPIAAQYGYCPKGTSVILYANEDLRHYQFHVQVYADDAPWLCGVEAFPSPLLLHVLQYKGQCFARKHAYRCVSVGCVLA